MAGEAYPKRWPAGFVDNDTSKYADAQFLNNAEAALLRLLGADPIDQGVQVWDAGLGRMKSIKLTNSQIDPAAAIDKSKLAALNIVDADISGAAGIAKSKLNLNGAITSADIQDGTIVNADINVSAAIAQSKLALDAWTAYSPVWTTAGTAPAIGNGTLVGKFAQVGKTVIARIILTAGTTTTFGTLGWSFTLPVAAAAAEDGLIGNVAGLDSSVPGWFPGTALLGSTTTLSPVNLAAPAASYTNAAPFAWATGDKFVAHLMYEAA